MLSQLASYAYAASHCKAPERLADRRRNINIRILSLPTDLGAEADHALIVTPFTTPAWWEFRVAAG